MGNLTGTLIGWFLIGFFIGAAIAGIGVTTLCCVFISGQMIDEE